jgi:uncharacterized protein (DUF1697 family)
VSAYAAFLRGINLGPNRRIGSGQLSSMFEAMGFRGVNTFRTSGNVVFESDGGAAADLTAKIEKALADALGYEVAVFLRTADEVRAIAEHEPFERRLVEASDGKLQVTMLARKPTARVREAILAQSTDADRLAFHARELYWLPSGPMRDSGLDLRAIDKLLGSTTMRTKGTIEELVAKFFAA